MIENIIAHYKKTGGTGGTSRTTAPDVASSCSTFVPPQEKGGTKPDGENNLFHFKKQGGTEVEHLEAAPLLVVPPVPPVPPQKNEMQRECKKSTTPTQTNDAFFADDRHFCRECRHLNRSGFCTAQRFRPVDDMPRRCVDFTGYPDRIEQSASNAKPEPATPTAPPVDPLAVEVWTPGGTPMRIKADNAAHAAWLRRMNPKPENPAPKTPIPEPDTERISEAEHNAQGRYFKFLATWPDGSCCYLCQMPRQTIDEMHRQYPTATNIKPVLNEEYPHED